MSMREWMGACGPIYAQEEAWKQREKQATTVGPEREDYRRSVLPFGHQPTIYICTMSTCYFYIHRREAISGTKKEKHPAFEIGQL